MIKRTAWTVAAVALVAGVMAAWALDSGPAAKSDAPMLHIDAFNDTGGAYCVTCRAGVKPTVVAFVTHNDEATQELLVALDKELAAGKDKHLNVAVAIVGSGDQADGLKTFITDKDLKVPAAIVDAASNKDYKNWKINGEASNTVVFINQHKIERSVANAKVDDLKQEA